MRWPWVRASRIDAEVERRYSTAAGLIRSLRNDCNDAEERAMDAELRADRAERAAGVMRCPRHGPNLRHMSTNGSKQTWGCYRCHTYVHVRVVTTDESTRGRLR